MRFLTRCTLSFFSFLLPVLGTAQVDELQGLSNPQAIKPEWKMPRTEYGQPDLQGTWWFGSRTPMQRPVNMGEKKTYTPEEAAAIETSLRGRLAQQEAPLDPNRGAPEQGARIGQEADDTFLGHWQKPELIPVNGQYRTSVIVEPSNGRIPLRDGFQDFHAKQRASGLMPTDGPEGQPLSGRCLMFGAVIPNLTPLMMNPYMQIFQTKDYVVILSEMIHDARIIRLVDQHVDSDFSRWMGDSIGRWEQDTLVVHTKNFRPEQSASRMFLPFSEALEVMERYTLVGHDEIHYAFTATDQKA